MTWERSKLAGSIQAAMPCLSGSRTDPIADCALPMHLVRRQDMTSEAVTRPTEMGRRTTDRVHVEGNTAASTPTS